FARENAIVSALCWGLAVTFVVCSIPLWLRQDLVRWARTLRCQFDPALRSAVMARGTLIAGTVLPVLALTAVVPLAGFGGEKLAGPNLESVFTAIGWTPSQVLPLFLLSLGLFGHGVSERSSGYSFSAGLVVNLAVSLIVWHQEAQPRFAHFWVHLL